MEIKCSTYINFLINIISVFYSIYFVKLILILYMSYRYYNIYIPLHLFY